VEEARQAEMEVAQEEDAAPQEGPEAAGAMSEAHQRNG